MFTVNEPLEDSFRDRKEKLSATRTWGEIILKGIESFEKEDEVKE